MAAIMPAAVIIATVLEPCANFSRAAMKKPRNSIGKSGPPARPANISWMAGPICAARSIAPNAPPPAVIRMITPALISAVSTVAAV